MTPIHRLRVMLLEEATGIRYEIASSDSDETDYLDGKLFALTSTIEKIDEIEPGPALKGP